MVSLNYQQSLQSQFWYSYPWGWYYWGQTHPWYRSISLIHLAHWPQSALPPITSSLLLLSQFTDPVLILVPSLSKTLQSSRSPNAVHYLTPVVLIEQYCPFLCFTFFLFLKHSHKHKGLKKNNHCCLQSILLSIISYDSPAPCLSNNYHCDLLYWPYNLLLPVLISSGWASW